MRLLADVSVECTYYALTAVGMHQYHISAAPCRVKQRQTEPTRVRNAPPGFGSLARFRQRREPRDAAMTRWAWATWAEGTCGMRASPP